MRRRSVTPHSQDRGSVLAMTLLLVIVFGALAGSIAGYGYASFHHTSTVRTQTSLRVSAEGGLRATIDQLKRHQTLCADATAATTPLAITPNRASITVTCTAVGGEGQGANGWAVILTGAAADDDHPSLKTQEGGEKKIGGSVYMAVPSSHDLKADLVIEDGDLWYPSGDCSTASPPSISRLTITPAPPRGTICTTLSWPSLVPTILLPPVPSDVDPAGRDDLVTDCRVFFPGKYTAPPALGEYNYFVSGDYYFEFDDVWEIKQSTVIGGAIDPVLGDAPYISAPPCEGVLENVVVAAAEDGYGNSWFMGARAAIDLRNHGKIELFRRRQGNQAISLMAVSASGSGYVQSTITLPGDTPIITTQEGSNNDMVIHGLINAPLAQVAFGNVSGDANGQVLGGVVAAGISLDASAQATGLVVGSSTMPVDAKILITSTATSADGQTVSVQAVVDYRPSRLVIDGDVNGAAVTSESADFSEDDVGHEISGAGIPGGAVITAVTVDGMTATISPPATANGTDVSVVIETPQIAINSWRVL